MNTKWHFNKVSLVVFLSKTSTVWWSHIYSVSLTSANNFTYTFTSSFGCFFVAFPFRLLFSLLESIHENLAAEKFDALVSLE